MQNKVKEFNNDVRCHKEPMPVYARLLDIVLKKLKSRMDKINPMGIGN